MFWSDWGEVPKIERASMDGTNSTRTVIINDKIFWPNGLTVDYNARRLYWADAKLGFISSMDFDGGNRHTVSNNQSGSLSHLFALTLFGDMLYWTDWVQKGIHSCNKTSGQRERSYLNETLSPMGITVFDPARQPKSSSTCQVNNGGCSHLCLLSSLPPYYSCACPTGIKLMQDGKTCRSNAEKILLLARKNDIRQISLDTYDYTAVVLPIQNIKHCVTLDYDVVDKKMYWMDDDLHVIKRSRLDGSMQETIVSTQVDHPDGIAIDWIARNLYWTDAGTDRIEVARLNGDSRKILLSVDLDQPRAIALHPEAGIMFWTDWGKVAKIERAALDGSQRVVIVNTSLTWPNGLAIDYELGTIYWGDAKTDVIETSRFDGSKRRKIIEDNLPHLFGFTLLNEWIYWTDWQRRSVERAHKLTGKNRETLIDQLPDLMGLKAVYVNKTIGTNACAFNNGKCTHLCFNLPETYVCACPTGYELAQDNRTCSMPEAYLLMLRQNDISQMSFKSPHSDIVLVSGLQNGKAFDVDIFTNFVYWTDSTLKTISKSSINGSKSQVIVRFALQNPISLAIDWIAKNLYWTDIDLRRIEVVRCDGLHRRLILQDRTRMPYSVAVNPNDGYLFWSEWINGRIERSSLDGSNKTIIVDDIGKAISLTIDLNRNIIYWINLDVNHIAFSYFDGTGQSILFQNQNYQPISLAFLNDSVYFVSNLSGSLEVINSRNSTLQSTLKRDASLNNVSDLFVYNVLHQNGWNLCGQNNGGCEHLCFSIYDHKENQTVSQCSCATHYTLYDHHFCHRKFTIDSRMLLICLCFQLPNRLCCLARKT